MKTAKSFSLDEVRSRRSDILRIAAEHGASNIRIFGSVARGTADEESDIDFLAEFEKGRSLLDLSGLQLDLEALLDHKVDVGTPNSLKERIRVRVLSEAIAL